MESKGRMILCLTYVRGQAMWPWGDLLAIRSHCPQLWPLTKSQCRADRVPMWHVTCDMLHVIYNRPWDDLAIRSHCLQLWTPNNVALSHATFVTNVTYHTYVTCWIFDTIKCDMQKVMKRCDMRLRNQKPPSLRPFFVAYKHWGLSLRPINIEVRIKLNVHCAVPVSVAAILAF